MFLNKNKGFTLIELLIVALIIGLLAVIVFSSLTEFQKRGRDARRKTDLRQVQSAVELYYREAGQYPACRAFSVWSAVNWGNGSPSCLYQKIVTEKKYTGSLPADPINKDGGAGNFLGDNAPTDRGYVYDSDGLSYTIGANLENGGGSQSELGNYQLKSQ